MDVGKLFNIKENVFVSYKSHCLFRLQTMFSNSQASKPKIQTPNFVSRIENVCVICLNVWWICSCAFPNKFRCVIFQNVINGRRNSIDKSVFMAWPCALNVFIFEWNLTYSSHETWIYLASHILIDHIHTYKVYKYFRLGTKARYLYINAIQSTH